MNTRFLVLLIVGFALLAKQAPAQTSAKETAELGLAYSLVQQENIDQIKLYRWKTYTTMKKEGEAALNRTVSNRLNEKGEMVQELVDEESADRDKRGVRGRKQDKGKSEKEELLEHIVGVVASYIFMSKGEEVDFFDNAKITDGEGDLAGTRVVRATDVATTGDVVEKYIDPEALLPKQIKFQFEIDGHKVNGEVMYRQIENGPNVPRFATIRIVDMEAVVETEFLEYSKQL
jgi:hypothetical protein